MAFFTVPLKPIWMFWIFWSYLVSSVFAPIVEFKIVRLYPSTCPLLGGMTTAFKWCLVPMVKQNIRNFSFISALPLPLIILRGTPETFVIALRHLMTGSVDVFFTAWIRINFVNASIITKTCILPALDFTNGSKWSMCAVSNGIRIFCMGCRKHWAFVPGTL